MIVELVRARILNRKVALHESHTRREAGGNRLGSSCIRRSGRYNFYTRGPGLGGLALVSTALFGGASTLLILLHSCDADPAVSLPRLNGRLPDLLKTCGHPPISVRHIF